MSISLEKQTLTLIKTVGRDTHITWLEQDILVPDTKPDVMKIIRVEAIPLIGNVDVIDGAIRVSGEITYYVLYRSADENKTKGISMTYPYTQTINVPDAKRGMHARVSVNVRNTIYSLPNERKVSIKTELIFRYVVRELSNVSLIKGIDSGENIEHKESQEVFYNVLAIKNDVIDAREDIVLQSDMPKISEILRVNAGIVNTEYKVSYNKILVKGDVKVEIGYMSSVDGNSIHSYVVSIPFTGMIEFENISENSKFDIKYNLRNLEIMLASQDSNMLTISAEVAVEALMFEEKTVTYIDDFYSTSKNLRFETSNVAVIKNKTMVNKQISLKENLGPVDAGNKIVNYTTDTGHLNTKISGGNLYVDGPLKVSAIFMNNETGVVDSKTFDLLVNTTIPLGMEVSEENVSVELTPMKQDLAIVGDNLEANIVLDANIEMENVDKITLIGEIEESDMDQNEFDSMYIYIIKKGDTLWNIAKKYKTTVAKITNINNITDENKIDIGQKILIIR